MWLATNVRLGQNLMHCKIIKCKYDLQACVCFCNYVKIIKTLYIFCINVCVLPSIVYLYSRTRWGSQV